LVLNKKVKISNDLLHIVGGGINQVPLVKTAKKLGFRVLVTDMYPSPPCRDLADCFEQINTTDLTKTLACSKRYQIDHITTDQTDVAVPTVAYIAEKLGLSGIGTDIAEIFTNKYNMRKALSKRLNHCIPDFKFFDSADKAVNYFGRMNPDRQFIVKPVNSQGSKGVSILDSNIQSKIYNAYHESNNCGVILERFITGSEYSVESFIQGDLVHNLYLVSKDHYRTNECLDVRNTFFRDNTEPFKSEIFDLNEQIIKSLGLKMGNVHAEYKVQDNQIYLIEIAARGGGGGISGKIIPYLTGFDPLEAQLKQLLGKLYDVEYKIYSNRYAILKFFDLPVGKIKSISNENIHSDNLLEFNMNVTTDSVIKKPNSSNERVGYFIAVGNSKEEVLRIEKEVENSIKVEYY